MGLAWKSIVVPAVLLLIFFLSFTSQILFLYIEPQPLERNEVVLFNSLLACLLICYARAIRTDPGSVPVDWAKRIPGSEDEPIAGGGSQNPSRQRWCRKCKMLKPPRAHHCKTCQKCIPKMDHHCPWTLNCVSHTTFPHFIRFVLYCVVTMSYLEYFLYVRAGIVWESRHLPSYYGPSVFQLSHLFALVTLNSFTLFMLTILLIRSLWCLVVNTTTIEGWEIERHETLVRRARYLGGCLNGPDGIRIRITKQEFPYDIGIWRNIVQGMGTSNPLAWFWPFAATPSVESSLSYETNGFEDPSIGWPPPDPDRIPRVPRPASGPPAPSTHQGSSEVASFRKRQAENMKRWRDSPTVRRRQPFHARYEANREFSDYGGSSEEEEVDEGEEAWRNSEGERLQDFGVDEEVEFYDEDEDDIPLAELMRRRRGR
ncbi:zf-DHHC-domain-containing protein [Trichodelitschia bisporula]|uniref:Palmitoyltransferase PFA4 n=1 Tax=Trichodelitschia bisporula TaxID=703511 RepID=A0A6G1I6Y7_9PEZI|nr:zf-DHHC-domain-containing protein [Trichodelitschia bisporula]